MADTLENHNYHGIDATIVADSINEYGDRLTTMVVTFPRIVLAEFNTHRMFSRNSASSRAIPFKKMVKKVREHPFIPIAWQKDHKGMQGVEYWTEEDHIQQNIDLWLESRDYAVKIAKVMSESDITKQLCNRLLEPFMWHTVIVTATEWENFFYLRCPQYYCKESGKVYRSRAHFCESETGQSFPKTEIEWFKCNKGQAEIHISLAAEAMWDAMNESTPKELKAGEWHIPFGDKLDEDRMYEIADESGGDPDRYNEFAVQEAMMELPVKIATARCARVSYLNYEGKDDYLADIKLHDRLSSMGHWSPFEHCAKAMTADEYDNYSIIVPEIDNHQQVVGEDSNLGWCRNFKGFVQYREIIGTP